MVRKVFPAIKLINDFLLCLNNMSEVSQFIGSLGVWKVLSGKSLRPSGSTSKEKKQKNRGKEGENREARYRKRYGEDRRNYYEMCEASILY